MGEDTCARAKVLAKREARNLHAFSWRLIFARKMRQRFSSPAYPPFSLP